MVRLDCIVTILIIIGVIMIYFGTSNLLSVLLFTSQMMSTLNEKSFAQLSPTSLIHLDQTIKRIAAIDRIFLISLPARVDRRTTSIALFQTLHLDLVIVPALHPQSAEVLSRRHHLLRHPRLSPLELACWASHMQLWTHIALTSTSNDSWTLIFEDDVDVEMAIVEIVESFPREVWTRAEMIYLGYCGNPRGELVFKGRDPYQIHRAVNPSCTHAYAIRSATARKLVNLLPSPQQPIDMEIVRLHDEEKLLIFGIHPAIAIQNRRSKSSINMHEDHFHDLLRRKLNRLKEWWHHAETPEHLNNSTLSQIDVARAKAWQEKHEGVIWRTAS